MPALPRGPGFLFLFFTAARHGSRVLALLRIVLDQQLWK